MGTRCSVEQTSDVVANSNFVEPEWQWNKTFERKEVETGFA
jgi:hypothetical protein